MANQIINVRQFSASVNVAPEVALIAKRQVNRVPSMEKVRMETLWNDRPVVMQGAVRISSLTPLLQANRVRLVGIGFDDNGLQDFVEGDFFSGELYIDSDRGSYNALGFRTLSLCEVLMALIKPSAWKPLFSSEVPGNMEGDNYQNGGCIVVGKGGKQLLLIHRENGPIMHVTNEEILKSLGITEPPPV